jgi:hypothetical protein
MLLTAGTVLSLGWVAFHDQTGLMAGAVAAGVCLLAAWLALVLCEPLRSPQHLLALVLVGTVVRMGVPFAAILVIFFLGRPLADAGFVYYLMVFYPIALVAETAQILPGRQAKGSDSAN